MNETDSIGMLEESWSKNRVNPHRGLDNLTCYLFIHAAAFRSSVTPPSQGHYRTRRAVDSVTSVTPVFMAFSRLLIPT